MHERSAPRRAASEESDAVADLYLASRRAAYPAIPPSVHPDDDVRRHFSETVFTRSEVWVLGAPGALRAMLVSSPGWVEHLYVAPGWWRRGLGGVLLGHAMARQGVLELWAFEANHAARAFYEAHGFIAVAATDGDNEEGAPDVRYRWTRAAGHTS